MVDNIRASQDWLRYYPQLARLTEPAWLEAAAHAQEMQLTAGMRLFHPERPGCGLLFLVEGRVRVFMSTESGREIILYRMQDAEVCILTLAGLLQNIDYPVEAITETESRAVMLPSHDFHAAFAASPGFRDFILGELIRHLHGTLLLLREVAFERLDIRLACHLFRRFREASGKRIHVTHQQLAQELGTTREVVSRMLKEMEKRGCITLHRGHIELKDDGMLAELSYSKQVVNSGRSDGIGY